MQAKSDFPESLGFLTPLEYFKKCIISHLMALLRCQIEFGIKIKILLMKKVAIVLMLVVSFAACNKIENSEPVAQLNGIYSNDISSNTCDEYVQVLSFDEKRLYNVDLFAPEGKEFVVDYVPFTISYPKTQEEWGVIVPAGHEYIDSIYFSADNDGDGLVALIFRNDSDYQNDFLQLFTKSEWMDEFLRKRSAAAEQDEIQPYCIGPASETDIDITNDIVLDMEFILPKETDTKDGAIVNSAVKWLGETFLGSTISYGVVNLFDCLFKSDDTTVVNEKTLNSILSKLDLIDTKLSDIGKRIKELDGKFERKVLLDKVEERNKMYSSLHTVNYRYYTMLKNLSKTQSDTAKLKEAIVPIIKEWGNTPVEGGSLACYSLEKIINMINGYSVYDRNLFQVYDILVYNTHRWEHEGYGDRESFRTGDFGMVTECYFLTKLFYSATNEKAMSEKADADLRRFIDFYKKNPVERHDNACICQIENAHLYLEKKARRIAYDDPTWINGQDIAAGISNSSLMFTWDLFVYENQPQKFLKPDEVSAIVNAYDKKESLTSILVNHGCCEAIPSSPTYIPLAIPRQSGLVKQHAIMISKIDESHKPEWLGVSLFTILDDMSFGFKPLGICKIIAWGIKYVRTTSIGVHHFDEIITDCWYMRFNGWLSQDTMYWWNYDVIKRY